MKLSEFPDSRPVKMLLLGRSGAGKTGAMLSLVKAGYQLYIIDFDNGVDFLQKAIKHECPELAYNVDVEMFRDRYKIGPAGPQVLKANALIRAGRQIDKWLTEVEWTPKHILVIDSLTHMGRATRAFVESSIPTRGKPDTRSVYLNGQPLILDILVTVTDAAFAGSLICISHVASKDIKDERQNIIRTDKYVSALGPALGEQIPTLFNTMILSSTVGSGSGTKHQLHTVPNGELDLRNPAPMLLKPAYSIETGLADIFKALH